MSLSSSINDGATAMSPTGGTAINLVSMGLQGNANRCFVSQDTSLLTRRTVEFSVKESKPNAASPGGQTQPRRKVILTVPRQITVNGVLVNTSDKVTIEMSTDISATNAQIDNLRFLAAQLLADTEYNEFYRSLSLA